MILADTSVWVDHFRTANAEFASLLEDAKVLMHPAILGELACGNLRDRPRVIEWLRKLPQTPGAGNNEVMILIESKRLYGLGVGWIDAHLIASALLTDSSLWTLDRRLGNAAAASGVRVL